MGKRASTKRLSAVSQSALKSVDIKARKRVEELYELTDEIINAYNEINEKYVHQIYRKFKQLQEINKKLKEKLTDHHCTGCKCSVPSANEEEEGEEEEEEEEESEHSIADEDDDEQAKNSTLPSSTTRTKKKNPFIISDIEDTQIFDANDIRLNHNISDDDDGGDKMSTDTKQKPTKDDKESGEESDEEVDGDTGIGRLPIDLQNIIKRKAQKNKNAKLYLLQIPRFPALCEYLRDRSHTSFDHRPSEAQVRPLITQHISQHLANNSKIRMRLRDELREIHRSYMRTFMTDPHATGPKPSVVKNKQLIEKTSPM